MISRTYISAIVLMLSVLSCKEVYKPAIISSPAAYLVVEGVLNVSGITSISISRTTSLGNTGFIGETGAKVMVEGKDNVIRPLSANGNGVYSSPDLNLVLNAEYRLRIRTSGGKEYLSEYVKAIQTPPIDSITWRQGSNGLQISVTTHDASGNTRYYRWEYNETWEIWSYYASGWIYIPDSNLVRRRFPAEEVSVGWKFDSSKTILLGSSARLATEFILGAPVNFINADDEKLAIRYSILVRQYALNKEGYAFFELMKRNTESLGTVFDAQPSEIKSNIQCVSDPREHVVGYITVSTVAEKRIFISNQQLQSWRYRQDCPSRKVLNDPDSIRLAFQGSLLPWDIEYSGVLPGQISHYISSFGRCVDVTRRGATLVKPLYW